MKTKYLLSAAALLVVATVSLPVAQVFAQTPSPMVTSVFKKHIFNRFRIGTISAINGSVITLTARNGKSYTVNTTTSTKFIRHFGGLSRLSEFSVNDKILVFGSLDTTTNTITAKRIRDYSVQKFNGTFVGLVTAKEATNVTLKTHRGTQVAIFDANTTFVNRHGKAITFSTITVGDRLRLSGTWDKTLNKITEIKKIWDLSQK